MHTKREIVCTGLPDAMLIKNTALTKTQMAPSRTALPGIRPVQVLSNLSRRADSLNGAIPILSPKSGQSLGRRPIHKLKFVYTGRLYICTNLKMGKKKGAMEMAARTASKQAKAQSKRRLVSQKIPRKMRTTKKVRRQRKVLHLIPKDSQFNGDDDNEEVHTAHSQNTNQAS